MAMRFKGLRIAPPAASQWVALTVFGLIGGAALQSAAGDIVIGGLDQNSPLMQAAGAAAKSTAESGDLAGSALLGGIADLGRPRPAAEDAAYGQTNIGGLTVQSLLVENETKRPRDGTIVTYPFAAPVGCQSVEKMLRLDLWVSGKADGRVKLTCTPFFTQGDGKAQSFTPFTCFSAMVPEDGTTLRAARKALKYRHEAGDNGPWTLIVDVKREDTGETGRLSANYYVECPAE